MYGATDTLYVEERKYGFRELWTRGAGNYGATELRINGIIQ